MIARADKISFTHEKIMCQDGTRVLADNNNLDFAKGAKASVIPPLRRQGLNADFVSDASKHAEFIREHKKMLLISDHRKESAAICDDLRPLLRTLTEPLQTSQNFSCFCARRFAV